MCLIYRHLVQRHITYNVSIYNGANPRAQAIAAGSRRANEGMSFGGDDGTLYDIMYHLNTLPPTNSLTHGILLGHRGRILSRDNGGRRPSVTSGYDQYVHIFARVDVVRRERVKCVFVKVSAYVGH